MKHTYLSFVGLILSLAVAAQTPGPIIGGSAPLCGGSTILLTDATTGGTWSNGSSSSVWVNSATGTVTGIGSGPGTITYTTASGSVFTTVTVIPLPTAYTVTGGGVGCIGSGGHIGLSGSDAGYFYQLYNGATFVSPGVPGTGVALDFGLMLAGGTYTVIGVNTVTGCVRSMVGSATVTIVSAPSAITAPSTICVGLPTTLSDSVSGGTWSSSDVYIATIELVTGDVAGVAAGTVTISYTIGGCVASKLLTITAGSCSGTPAAGATTSGSSVLCPCGATTLTLSGDSLTCNLDYQWQASPDGTTFTNLPGATTRTYNYTPVSSQYYRCKVTCIASSLFSFSTPEYIAVHSGIASHSVSSPSDTVCSGPGFYLSACGVSSSFTVTTWFGDGASVSTPLTSTAPCSANVSHNYSSPGTYNVKQVLFSGAVPQDSISFSYEYLYCKTLPVKFYFDANSDCIYDTGDAPLLLPVVTEIDSNGMPIDTVSTTSGFYYKASGPTGTVYAFRVISVPVGLVLTCPVSNILYDTIQSLVNNYRQKYFGLNCGTGSEFDLAEYVTTRTGRHMQSGTILVSNSFCAATAATIKFTFSPLYNFEGAYPPASSVSGNTATWNLAAIYSGMSSYPLINFTLTVPSTWLIPGDTIMSTCLTNPLTGDIDTTNNFTKRIDTVVSSYDPNEMSVIPQGNIPSCTKLQYTVNFENTGNDTAHNISIMDTLSDDLDPHSLNIEIASSAMNIAIVNDGLHNIVKFDFPGINLLDSTHHNQCDGVIIFNVKTKPGLSYGSQITNYAGIFFDDNPVVMTDTVTNQVGLPSITGMHNVCIGGRDSLAAPAGFNGGVWATGGTAIATIGSASGIVAGVSAGAVTIIYTFTNSCGATPAFTTITINPSPVAYHVTGGGGFCGGSPGVHIGLDSSSVGAVYHLYYGATIFGAYTGSGSALDFGTYAIPGIYTVMATNIAINCSALMEDSAVLYIASPVTPSVGLTVGPGDTLCEGVPVSFTPLPVNGGSTPGYLWSVNGTDVSSAGAYTFLPANGDLVTLTLTSSEPCAIPASVSDAIVMTVESPLSPSAGITAVPGTTIGVGEAVTLSAGVMSAGASIAYQWFLNGVNIPGATAAAYTGNSFFDQDSLSCVITTANVCGAVTITAFVIITVNNGEGVMSVGANEEFSIFPNPNDGVFTVIASLPIPENRADLTMTDVLGQVIYENTVVADDGKINKQIQLSKGLAKGIYMLSLRSGSQNKVLHFVIE